MVPSSFKLVNTFENSDLNFLKKVEFADFQRNICIFKRGVWRLFQNRMVTKDNLCKEGLQK